MTSSSCLHFLYPRGVNLGCQALTRRSLFPLATARFASGQASTRPKDKEKKKKKKRNTFINQPLNQLERFALCDAMRYIRAFEVGQDPRSAKYDIAVRMRTLKNALTIRGNIQLPHAVDTSIRVCVICPPDSPIAEKARKAGAAVIGEESVFEAVKEGRIDFDRCICHDSSLEKLQKSGIARILGPRGLMPSVKLGTVTKDVPATLKTLSGGTEYRERMATIRCSVGQLGFTPKQMQDNVKAFMARIKQDCARVGDQVSKEVHEVVLSSTRSPGFSLNGDFRSAESLPVADLSIS